MNDLCTLVVTVKNHQLQSSKIGMNKLLIFIHKVKYYEAIKVFIEQYLIIWKHILHILLIRKRSKFQNPHNTNAFKSHLKPLHKVNVKFTSPQMIK
jgi:hypothetical protein